jgi:riboflavin transporter FmnP
MMVFPLVTVLAETASSSGGVTIENPLKTQSIEELINAIANILQVLAIGVGAIMIIIAGIQYMTSAGSEEKAKKAKQTIIYALIGVAVVTSARFLIGLITEILGKK